LWSKRITERELGKADGFNTPEGRGPRSAKASDEGTTGIDERGMYTQG
jgi:hypothetical protein